MNTETSQLPDADWVGPMLRAALGQLDFARRYTLELLDATPRERWFELPAGTSTNVAWQLGHLAVSQYGLLLFRLRGRQPDDLDLIPGRFRKAYGRGSNPSPDRSTQPSAEELLERLQRVDVRARRELSELAEASPELFLEPVDMPYAAYPVKLGAVLFCPLHEQVHAGQIGSLRRGLGLDPVR